MVSHHSLGVTIADAWSGWLDASQKLIRSYVPKTVYSHLSLSFTISISVRRHGFIASRWRELVMLFRRHAISACEALLERNDMRSARNVSSSALDAGPCPVGRR